MAELLWEKSKKITEKKEEENKGEKKKKENQFKFFFSHKTLAIISLVQLLTPKIGFFNFILIFY